MIIAYTMARAPSHVPQTILTRSIPSRPEPSINESPYMSKVQTIHR